MEGYKHRRYVDGQRQLQLFRGFLTAHGGTVSTVSKNLDENCFVEMGWATQHFAKPHQLVNFLVWKSKNVLTNFKTLFQLILRHQHSTPTRGIELRLGPSRGRDLPKPHPPSAEVDKRSFPVWSVYTWCASERSRDRVERRFEHRNGDSHASHHRVHRPWNWREN